MTNGNRRKSNRPAGHVWSTAKEKISQGCRISEKTVRRGFHSKCESADTDRGPSTAMPLPHAPLPRSIVDVQSGGIGAARKAKVNQSKRAFSGIRAMFISWLWRRFHHNPLQDKSSNRSSCRVIQISANCAENSGTHTYYRRMQYTINGRGLMPPEQNRYGVTRFKIRGASPRQKSTTFVTERRVRKLSLPNNLISG
jgi:hypothetical protein